MFRLVAVHTQPASFPSPSIYVDCRAGCIASWYHPCEEICCTHGFVERAHSCNSHGDSYYVNGPRAVWQWPTQRLDGGSGCGCGDELAEVRRRVKHVIRYKMVEFTRHWRSVPRKNILLSLICRTKPRSELSALEAWLSHPRCHTQRRLKSTCTLLGNLISSDSSAILFELKVQQVCTGSSIPQA